MSTSPARRRISIVVPPESEDFNGTVARAIAAARLAQVSWAARPVQQRLACVRELRHLVAAHARELAEASAWARGRPAGEVLTAEVLPLLEACRFAEQNAERILAPTPHGFRGRPAWLNRVRTEIHREPYGVVLVIGPGNYPLFLPGVQVIQALVAGNGVLLKPGEGGLAASIALRELIIRAGFPAHLVVVLPETTEAAQVAIGARPNKVIFTGSATTGEKILAQLAPHLVPAILELSGCDAAVVRHDADLDLTVKALAFGLRLNNGATCLSPKRVFVHRSIATELEGRLAQEFNPRARSGWAQEAGASADSSSEANRVSAAPAAGGPVADRLRQLLEEALALGAHFLAGGTGENGLAQTPCVLAGVSPHSRLLKEDVFLPVLALVTVTDDNDAVLRVNNCPFALGASIFTRDEKAARALAARITVGTVSVNDLIVPTADPRVPFGGWNRSGFGTTRGAEGLLELTRPKVVTLTRGNFRPAFDPPGPADAGLIENYLQVAHGRGVRTRLGALIRLFRNLVHRKTSTHSKSHETIS